MIGVVFAGFASLLLALAAYSDIRTRLLPNSLSLSVFIVCAIGVGFQHGLTSLLPYISHACAALAVGFILYAWNWIGAGDAKLYAAVAVSIPIHQGAMLLFINAVSMLLLVIAWIALRLIRRSKAEQKEPKFRKVPLGVPIAVGSIVSIWIKALN